MDNTIILGSLSMDLKRVALGLHRGSKMMAQRFEQEARLRMHEVQKKSLAPYMRTVMMKLDQSIDQTDDLKKAEDMLMYSTIVQNYVLKTT